MSRKALLAVLLTMLFIALLIALPYRLIPIVGGAIDASERPARIATRNAELGGPQAAPLATNEARVNDYLTAVIIYGTPTRPPTRTPAS